MKKVILLVLISFFISGCWEHVPDTFSYRKQTSDYEIARTQYWKQVTENPRPTRTPKRTPTPKPTENTYCPPDEVAEAMSEFAYIMEKYNNSMKRMEDPSNNNWLEVSELSSLAERADRMDVPECLSRARYRLEEAMWNTSYAIDAFLYGYELAADKYKKEAISDLNAAIRYSEEVMDCMPNCTND